MTCHSFQKEKLSNLTMEVENTLGKMAADCQEVVWVETLRDCLLLNKNIGLVYSGEVVP